MSARPTVQRTEDFSRIEALPRRRLTLEAAEEWADALTPTLRAPGSSARLRPWQAMFLAEAVEQRGAWAAYPVGVGKTLPTYLLPILLGAKRPMLFVSGPGLRDKTRADFASYLRQWRTPNPPPYIATIKELSAPSGEHLLEQRKPDAIILDESDDWANPFSGACLRMDRYIVANRENVIVVALTATPSRMSIMGYWHILCWCLGDGAPVPLKHGEASMWALAIDHKPSRFGQRVLPGPLGRDVASARAWYRDRLVETPGVLIVDGDSCDQPLTVRVRLPKECPKIDKHYRRFMVERENPDGIPVSDPLSRWKMDGFLGCGVFQKYEPPPPQEWRDARREVAAFCRDEIEASQSTARPLDTEGKVIRRYPDAPAVARWLAVKDQFNPDENTVAIWLSTATLESAAEWLAESDEPGIVWCGGVEFATVLAEAVGLPYYRNEGQDASGRGLHAADPRKSLVASWHANKKGYNLQAWRRQLIVHPPQSAKWYEQIFGRSHRSGQDRGVVVDVLGTSGGILDGFETAIGEARFAKQTIVLTQKLLRAKIIRATPRVTESNRYRWARRGDA